MDRLALYFDDVDHACRMLEPLLGEKPLPVHLVLVACAPRLTHRIGKWVAHSAREKWRDQWAAKQRNLLQGWLDRCAPEVQCEWVVAQGPLQGMTQRMRQRHGSALQVVDLRRPKLGQMQEPLTASTAAPTQGERLTAPLAVTSGLAVVLALAD